MKTTPTMTRPGMGTDSNARRRIALPLPDRTILLAPPRTERSRIQWPTGQQMRDVSKRLARISREGIRREISGDYFNSGDFAYRIQEIIRATDELLKKSQRP